jgi:hypothetical protein
MTVPAARRARRAAAGRNLPYLLIALAIGWGGYLRLAHLGEHRLGVDEMLQFFAAESLNRGESPQLPSGAAYRRGIDVTRLTAASMDRFGPSLLTMRLPNALLGVLNLVIFAGVLIVLGGRWAAVVGTLLLAIYPEAIYQSRHLRFYTYQLNFGLLALLTGWLALRGAGADPNPRASELIGQWGWLLATVLLLALAARVQVTALSVALGWATCVTVAAAANVRVQGWGGWGRNPPLQLLVVGLAAALALSLFRPDVVLGTVQSSQFVDFWARGTQTPLAYYYMLVERFPLIVGLAPAIFWVLFVRQARLAIYLGVWFAVPVVLHSVVFPWQGERFVLLAVPALFAAAAIAASWAGRLLYESVTRTLAPLRWTPPFRSAVAGALVIIAGFTAIFTMPAASAARKTLRNLETDAGWHRSLEILASDARLADIPLGHTAILNPLYYWGRLDFSVAHRALYQPLNSGAGSGWGWLPQGSRDYYMGVPILSTPESVRRHFADRGSVLIGYDDRFGASLLEAGLHAVLLSEAVELCRGTCGTLRLYHWVFDSVDDTDSSADPGHSNSGGGTAHARSLIVKVDR